MQVSVRRVGMAGLLVAALCAGCAAVGSARLESLDNVQQPLLGDLRLPPGARIDNSQSMILGGGPQWTGRAVIQLSQGPSDVFAYLRDQLPAAGWTGVSAVKARTSILVFTRQDRTLTVEIVEAGNLVRGGSLLTLTASPKGSFWAPPAAATAAPRSAPATAPAATSTAPAR